MSEANEYKIESADIAASVTRTGGALCGLSKKSPSGEFVPLMGCWPSSQGGMTSGYVMEPVVGVISTDGQVLHDGKVYAPGKHGIARKVSYDVNEAVAQHVRLTHTHDPAKSPGLWPLPYACELTYLVAGNELTASMAIENQSENPMPFSAGLHPAFVWPLPGCTGKEGHSLTLSKALPQGTRVFRPKDAMVFTDAECVSPFTPLTWELDPQDFAKDAYFFVFPKDADLGELTLTYQAPGSSVKLQFIMTGWSGFGVWNKPGFDFLCIEPFTGVPLLERDGPKTPALKDVRNLTTLPAKATFKASFRVLVD